MEAKLRQRCPSTTEFLGKTLLQRNRAFCDYHEGKMKELGIACRRGRLALGLK